MLFSALYFDNAVHLNTLTTVLLIVIGAVCAFGAALCHQSMIEEMAEHLKPEEHMRFPGARVNTFKVYRLHKKYFPVSKVRSRWLLLGVLGLSCYAAIMAMMIYTTLLR